MNQAIEIKATVACWARDYSLRELRDNTANNRSLGVVNSLAFYGKPETEKFSDWIRVGEADVTVRLMPKDEQTRQAVQALQAKLAEERVKWHQRQQAILAEISKLQALTFDEVAA